MTSKINTESYFDIMKDYDPNKNITRNVMTKFEKTKVIGMRLEQLARGAQPFVDTTGLTNIRSIVMKELEERKIPFIISRTLPNGKNEYWRIADLIQP